MNIVNIALAVAMIAIMVIVAVASEGTSLPFSLPAVMFGLKMLGVPLQ